MLQYLILIPVLVLVSTPVSLFIGHRFLKLSQLKIWHMWLALLVSGIAAYIGFFVQFLALIGPIGFVIFWLIIGILILWIFYRVLKKFVNEITFTQSFWLEFSIFGVLSLLFFIWVPIQNAHYFQN
jgi:hypothetical protein